jgi:MFS family permease
MNRKLLQTSPTNPWRVYGAISLIFFFVNFATFISLGIVLSSMVKELHWTLTEAGSAFSFLGLACGLSSPLPAMLMKRWGGRMTVSAGAALLVSGFALAGASQDLVAFYTAMVLLGAGFTLTGNIPGVFLIAAWFESGAARLIGLYLMVGALGSAFGPPIVEASVRFAGWRGHWQIMAVVAAVTGLTCLVFVRDAVAQPAEAETEATSVRTEAGWTTWQAIFTPQFLVMAFAVAWTMTSVTMIESIVTPHLGKLGSTVHAAAIVLSIIAFTAAAVKGITGRLCEAIAPPRIVGAGLALQAVGTLMLMLAATPMLQYASALIFGAGWGLSVVAGTVAVVQFFGSALGSRILSVVTLITTIGVTGPFVAGAVADRFGTFAPMFWVAAAILAALVVPTFLMRRPVPPITAPVEPLAGTALGLGLETL